MRSRVTNQLLRDLLLCNTHTTDCVVGSQLSVVNKIAVSDIDYPNLILVLQFATASLLLGLAHALGMIKLENINVRTSIGFLPFVACFFALLGSGLWVMKVAPLETFIAFKSTTPIVLSLLDYLFMGRMFPGAKSIVAMIGITIGAIWYVSGDVKSEDFAYVYCAIFVFVACIEGGVAKDTINRYQMNSWSRTFLVNTLSIPIGIVLSVFTGELENAINGKEANGEPFQFGKRGVIALVSSCFFGVGMGYFTMLIRDALSATSCAVVATCNKFLAEIVNFFIWKNHASLEGAGAVCLIMACGIFYEQAPLRPGESGFNPKTILPCIPRSVLGIVPDEDGVREGLLGK